MARAGRAPAGLIRAAKRWLYLIHRWIGIATCLLFLIWFASGLVMVYVPYPGLSDTEHLAGLPTIDWRAVRVGPAEAERAADLFIPPRSTVLEMTGDGPVWRVTPTDGDEVTLSARTGRRLNGVSAEQAVRTASAFARRPAAAVERLERDQWTVAGRYNAHRPLYRVRLAGAGEQDLYVSGRTGAVLLDTAAQERFWNWFGSVPHWIYPTILRQHPEGWRQVVMWVSGPCILVAITGMWIGILRARFGRRRFKGGRVSPYHGWMLWHHIAGLVGGVALTLWIFSGWLSVDPGHLFRSPGISDASEAAYAGARPLPRVAASRLASLGGIGARRVEFHWSAGRAWAETEGRGGRVVLDAQTLRPAAVSRAALIRASAALMPGAPIVAIEELTAPDFYWYEVGALPRLPVLQVRFGGTAATWVYLDPASGRVLGTIDRRGRAYRWLYDLFHKWDLNALTLWRPAWDVMLWLFSLIGIATSVSGIWIGWRRLRGQSGSRSG